MWLRLMVGYLNLVASVQLRQLDLDLEMLCFNLGAYHKTNTHSMFSSNTPCYYQ